MSVSLWILRYESKFQTDIGDIKMHVRGLGCRGLLEQPLRLPPRHHSTAQSHRKERGSVRNAWCIITQEGKGESVREGKIYGYHMLFSRDYYYSYKCSKVK
jgi:hypothetical protein